VKRGRHVSDETMPWVGLIFTGSPCALCEAGENVAR